MKIYKITPVPKPRMTRSDKWKKRACCLRYWAFCAEVEKAKVEIKPEGCSIKFVLPMAKSWPKKKKERMLGMPHQQTPDLSNLLKAIEDAVFGDDSHIWHYKDLKKVWGYEGEIHIKVD